MSLFALRQRMPVAVFLVLLAIVLVLAGFACACLSDHPLQALERLAGVPAPSSPAFGMWAFAALSGVALITAPVIARRLSQAQLQRFLV